MTEKTISNFIRYQFPQFYNEEGETFIQFVEAYYEWMEQQGKPIQESRNLLEYIDIDTTPEKFIEYFQKKYLYGIPANILTNKRFLLKHVQDLYRSKGSTQGLKLLFKLLYDEDIEIYFPGSDLLKTSDGTWVVPKYVELSSSVQLKDFIGKTVVGVSSGTTAVVESVTEEIVNNGIINVAHLSNIFPNGGDFNVGEKITFEGSTSNSAAVSAAPTVLGSLDRLEIISGGKDFNIGDVLKIVDNDNLGNSSYGRSGILNIKTTTRGKGAINYDVIYGGSGIAANSDTFVYRQDTTGAGTNFKVGILLSTETTTYNTDLLCDYANLSLNSTSFGFPLNPAANASTPFANYLQMLTGTFGSIYSLQDVTPGNGYTQDVKTFVRSDINARLPLNGTITYNSTSNNVIGVGTNFTTYFANDDVILLKANNSLANTAEKIVIKEVVSDTSLLLYGPPTKNSTASAKHFVVSTIYPSNFARYEAIMSTPNDSLKGENAEIIGSPSVGENIAETVLAIDSGKGYIDGEVVKAYLYSAVEDSIKIKNGGLGYSNNDVLIFSGGSPGYSAKGFIVTDNTGKITQVSVTYGGSGYEQAPTVTVKSRTGSGAVLTCNLTEYNNLNSVVGKVVKKGIGSGRGRWTTTRGFLNSDKRIQDSYYYQNMSYEIQTEQTLDKYKNILNEAFHVAGTEMFGKYLKKDSIVVDLGIINETVTIT